MEMVSYHFDHKSGKSVLGNQYLQLGFHNGINFYPLDMTMNTSSKRPNTNVKAMDKRTNSWKRRQEALSKRTDMLIEMVQRAWNAGIDASFFLFDSWFAHDDVINRVCKCGKVKYEYQGKKYTLKQLWQIFAKQRTTYLSCFQVKAACMNVKLPKTGDVRILFISNGRKQWEALL